MLHNKKIIVVLPAYNASKTLKLTFEDIPHDIVDVVLLVDDGSVDGTPALAASFGMPTFVHHVNYGFGRNNKTCYNEALKLNPDIVVILHPDYQYNPRLITAMVSMIANDVFDVVIASRLLGVGALVGGMPIYKYYINRLLTWVQNFLIGYNLSEYHTGYRAFSREVLFSLPLMENSDDFVFDNEMLCQIIYHGFRVGEVSCPTKYFEDSSSIKFWRGVIYAFGCLWTAIRFRMNKWHLGRFRIFNPKGRRLPFVEEHDRYYTAFENSKGKAVQEEAPVEGKIV